MHEKNSQLTQSQEEYLEAICRLSEEHGELRPSKLADSLGVSRASVTGALRKLTEKKMIAHNAYGAVALTDEGRAVAEALINKHDVIALFFREVLDLRQDESDECACILEHSIPEKVLKRFSAFADFISRCPHGKIRWQQNGVFCKHSHDGQNLCEQCALK